MLEILFIMAKVLILHIRFIFFYLQIILYDYNIIASVRLDILYVLDKNKKTDLQLLFKNNVSQY